MENLFTRFPALEDLIIDGYLTDASAFNLDISAPKLKQLEISFNGFAMISTENYHQDIEDFVCQMFINVDAPNLEELDIFYDFLVSYSLKNAICLSKGKIDFIAMEELEDRGYFLGLAGRIRHLFAGICTAKYLTVSAPLLVALDDEQQHLLSILENLNHLELQLPACDYLQMLKTFLKISADDHKYGNDKYCNDDNVEILVHEWNSPEFEQTCLISHLKTICLWNFNGCPNDMEVAKYLLKHGKALNKVGYPY